MAKGGKITRKDLIADDVIKGLQDLTIATNEAVQSFKKLALEAKTINKEIKGAKSFDQVSTATKRAKANTDGLSEAEKKLARATKQLEFELSEAGKEYAQINEKKKLAAKQNRQLAKSQQEGVKSTNTWSKAIGSFAFKFNALGNIAANALKTITSGIKRVLIDSVRMSLEFEGVKNAFNKLNDPNLLGKLQRATRGTVNDLELMKSAVQANNFKIPLEQFSVFLEFATNRAIDTGESVDYLVESIVKGLGRKSVLILDNLGLSVSEINEEVKNTGDFMLGAANVIQREMAKSGKVIDTNLIKLKELNAEFENIKLSAGTAVQKTIVGLVDRIRYDFNPAMSGSGRAIRKAIDEIDDYGLSMVQGAEQVKFMTSWLEQMKNILKGIEPEQKKEIETITSLTEELQYQQEVRDRIDITDVNEIARINNIIKAIQDRISAISELGVKDEETQRKIRAEEFKTNQQLFTNYESRKEAREKLADAAVQTFTNQIEAEIDAMFEADEAFFDSEERKTAKLKEEIDKRKEVTEQEYELKRQLADQTFQFLSAINDAQLMDTEAKNRKEAESLEQKYSSGLLTQEEYERARLRIEGEAEKESLKLRRRAALVDKAQALYNIALDTAQGVLKYASNPLTAPLIPFITALGIAQAAVVAATPLPQFGKGGDVEGPSHSAGGVNLNAEGGEYIVRKEQVKKHRSLIEAINNDTIGKDMLFMPTIWGGTQVENTADLIKETNELLKRISKKPVASSSITPSGINTAIHKGNTMIKKIDRYFG